ncbi:hypothetical protein ABPG74_004131 [Tetrahymena malaccensis]
MRSLNDSFIKIQSNSQSNIPLNFSKVQMRPSSRPKFPQINNMNQNEIGNRRSRIKSLVDGQFSTVDNNISYFEGQKSTQLAQDSKELSTFDKDMSNLELFAKLKDVEGRMIDQKAELERKINQISAKNEGLNIQSQLKLFEDQMMDKMYQQFQKMRQTEQETSSIQYKSLESELNSLKNQVSQLRLGIDDQKNQNQQLKKIVQNQQNNQQGQLVPYQQPVVDTSQMQRALMITLKEYINEQNRRRNNLDIDYGREFEQKMASLQREMIDRFNRWKQEIFQSQDMFKDQQSTLDKIKFEKIQEETAQLKDLIARQEISIKQFSERKPVQIEQVQMDIQNQLDNLKIEIQKEEKDLISSESKFVKIFQESIEQLSRIVKLNKEELSANQIQGQTLMNDIVSNLRINVENFKEAILTRMNLLDQQSTFLLKSDSENKKNIIDHFKDLNDKLERKFTMVEKWQQAINQELDVYTSTQNEKIKEIESQNDIWKKEFEQKNHTIFVEISNTMKILKSDFSKESQSTDNRLNDLMQRSVSNQVMNEQMVDNLAEHTKRMDEKIFFEINQIKEKTKYQLQDLKLEISENHKRDDKQLENKIALQIQQKSQEITDQTAQLIKEVSQKFEKNFVLADKILANNLQAKIEENYELVLKNLQTHRNETQQEIFKNEKTIQEQGKKIEKHKTEIDLNISKVQKDMLEQIALNNQETDNKIKEKLELERKTTNIALLKQETNANSKIEALSVKLNEDLSEQKNDLLKQFKTELHEIVLKKIMQSIEEETGQRKDSLQKLETNIQNNKNMLLHTLEQKVESNKALTRALIQSEQVERQKQHEDSMKILKLSLENSENNLKKFTESELQKLQYETSNQLKQMDAKTLKIQTDLLKQMEVLRNYIDDTSIDLQNQIYLQKQFNSLSIHQIDEALQQAEYQFVQCFQKIEQANLEQVKLHTEVLSNSKDLDMFIEQTEQNFRQFEDIIKLHEQKNNETNENINQVKAQYQQKIDSILQENIHNSQQLKEQGLKLHNFETTHAKESEQQQKMQLHINNMEQKNTENYQQIQKHQQALNEIQAQLKQGDQKQNQQHQNKNDSHADSKDNKHNGEGNNSQKNSNHQQDQNQNDDNHKQQQKQNDQQKNGHQEESNQNQNGNHK